MTTKTLAPERPAHRAPGAPVRGPKSLDSRRRRAVALAAVYAVVVGAFAPLALPWWGVWLLASPALGLAVLVTVAAQVPAAVTR